MRKSTDFREWHISWRAAIINLRMVGHVLHKVDGRRSPQIAKHLETRFEIWKRAASSHSWFNWLENERNLILKEGSDSVLFLEDTEAVGFEEQKVIVNAQVHRADKLIFLIYFWWLAEIELIENGARNEVRLRKLVQGRNAKTGR